MRMPKGGCVVCGRKLPERAVRFKDDFCSSRCCHIAHGVIWQSDLVDDPGALGSPHMLTRRRQRVDRQIREIEAYRERRSTARG